MSEILELSEVTIEDLLENMNVENKLVVFNDDVNSIEWVVLCFCKYLNHDLEQAVQCTLNIHNTGKAVVKTGKYDDLKPLKEALDEAGLTCEIQ